MLNLIKKVELDIWGRTFSLQVYYVCYEGEELLKEQVEMVQLLLSNKQWIQNAKKHIEKYCENDVMADKNNTKKDNIFSYIKPSSIFIERDNNPPLIALMCDYKYDLEHGLAVVFDSSGNVTVGIQDIIL